jgi:hypothetical protein
VVSFTFRQLCPLVKNPGTHWIGDWVDTRVGLDDKEKGKMLFLPGLEPDKCSNKYVQTKVVFDTPQCDVCMVLSTADEMNTEAENNMQNRKECMWKMELCVQGQENLLSQAQHCYIVPFTRFSRFHFKRLFL